MLTGIDLQYFKCFETLKLPLRPLTLLAGANGSGKSSVLHALALLHQTMRGNEHSDSLALNGNLVMLGSAADIIDQARGQGFCEIGLHDDETEYSWRLTPTNRDVSLTIAQINIDGEDYYRREHAAPLRYLLPKGILETGKQHEDFTRRMRRLSYLTTERIGTYEVYPTTLEDEHTPVFRHRKKHGAHVLIFPIRKPVVEELSLKNAGRSCLEQVEARMGKLFPELKLELCPLFSSKPVQIGLRNDPLKNHLEPIKFGSGMMQVLPLVVAALCTRPRDILLIEYPEMLLHGSGQADMGMFLAEVASAGVQVLLETHSDHILNGIRRAVKEGVLNAEDAALYLFRPRTNMDPFRFPQVESTLIDPNGNIDTWPTGFFDQFDKDLNYLAGWG